jgi:threonine aldolase
MINFSSDNVSSACPEVMAAVNAVNDGVVASYGDDPCTTNLQPRLSEIFETDVVVYPVMSGTVSNALALSALTPPWGKVYCHALSHINTDECGAPELFTGGAKLVPMAGNEGRYSAATLVAAIYGSGNVHHAQPASVSLAQACESGTIYQLDAIREISDVAHAHGMHMHMDGARFANALVSLSCSPAQMTWQSGVDVLSFGGTKNGCLIAEAVVFFKPELARDFAYRHKRAGQLISKMRFISAQLEAYVDNDLWLRNATHANTLAKRLESALMEIDGLELVYPVMSNEVFVRFSDAFRQGLRAAEMSINEEELEGSAARFVTAWNTRPEDVEELIEQLRLIANNNS